MTECWATSIEGCSDQISREHTISASLFLEEDIFVQGFDWCLEEPKKIGLASLTSKILCTKHNSLLSPLDQAGSKAFATLRDSTRIRMIRNRSRGPWNTAIKHSINGKLLERWFLKTLINLCYHRDFPIGEELIAGRPDRRLVRISFGLEEFKGHEGLYSVAKPGLETVWEDRVAFKPLRRDNHPLEGGLFFFRGLIFILWFGASEPPKDAVYPSVIGVDLSGTSLTHHLKKICDGPRQKPWQVCEFIWQ
jgi:hypothetical protein